jgi:5-methyltetrahydrofolate--homocysteine methyltransferase
LLGNHEQKEEFLEFINEDYEDIRADYFDNLKDKKYLSLAESRKRKLNIDWDAYVPRTFL